MTLSLTARLRQHPALAGLSDAGWSQLEPQLRYLGFAIGQPLSEAHVVPQQVLILLEGEARLLSSAAGTLTTLTKLGPGAMVGLASLLRAAPCEAVSASEAVVAVAIPDAVFTELLSSEASLRQWCSSTLFPAELAPMLADAKASLEQLLGSARLVPPSPEAVAAAQQAGLSVVVASANTDRPIGSPLATAAPLPEPRGPLPLRLIGLPAATALTPAPAGVIEESAALAVQPAGPVLGSDLDLGQADPARQLK
ncbi:MAG: cyclic nucleotide-binding domain-containing protein, partial [Cyanobacteria bacterium K_Offshore_0m_m2_072]|nr:cyclic nucleotide-binding domain-containing protein [Cyanobacteria bacterium K_Offshore_0m_m2_072]